VFWQTPTPGCSAVHLVRAGDFALSTEVFGYYTASLLLSLEAGTSQILGFSFQGPCHFGNAAVMAVNLPFDGLHMKAPQRPTRESVYEHALNGRIREAEKP
jgi:hypothetical protein